MRKIATSVLELLVLAGFAGTAQAAVYDFDAEPTLDLDTTHWSMSQAPIGQAYFGKVVLSNSIILQKNPGSVTYQLGDFIATNFNMATVGGAISSDFNVSVDYSGASLSGNHFYLSLATSAGNLAITGGERLLWSDNIEYSYVTAESPFGGQEFIPVEFDLVSGGSLAIARSGDEVSFLYNGNVFHTINGFNADITGISLGLVSDASVDYGTVTFSNFAINAVPEPASLTVMAATGAGLLLRRRR